MITLRSSIINSLTTLLAFNYKDAKHVASFKQRINAYNHRLDRYDRQFHMRAPDLSSKNKISFPITVPFRVRHRFNPKKIDQFVDNSSRIHWNRLTPNEILLGFENIKYLDYDEMMQGLRYLSQVKGQEQHDWNSHPWVSQALEEANKQFARIKIKNRLSVYYLMKKLKYSNPEFWKKMYAVIEENLYDLNPHEFEKFFLRYYQVSDQYFSPEMKGKFLALLENRLRSFSPEGIVKVYEIYQAEDKIDDYWKSNVFIPLFKSQQYTYSPKDLHKIFRFMLVLGHEKDDRLYTSLYKRLMSYQTLSMEELDILEEVMEEVKDLFISHRVDPYLSHLREMRKKLTKENSTQKKEIPIQDLVRQDLIFFTHKRKLKVEEKPTVQSQPQQKNMDQKATVESNPAAPQ